MDTNQNMPLGTWPLPFTGQQPACGAFTADGQRAAAQTVSTQLEQNDQATMKSFTKPGRRLQAFHSSTRVLALNKISDQYEFALR
jgi:hypothetical protein